MLADISKIYQAVLAVGYPEAHPLPRHILPDLTILTAIQEVLV